MHPRRTVPRSAAIWLTVLLPALAFPAPRDAVARAPASGQINCTVNLPMPIFIPMGLVPGGLVFDDACQFLYLTNPLMNRVEVLSLATMSFQEPVQVGAQPVGLDTAPGGALLYVANSGGNNLSVVDVTKRVEARKIRMPYDASRNDRPYSVAVASNGKAFYSTAFNGSGFGARVMELDLATEQSVQRLTVTQDTYIRRSHDRSAVAVVCNQNFQLYRTATGTFTPPRNTVMTDIGVDLAGSRFFVISGGQVWDANLNQIGAITGGTGSRGAVIDRGGVLAYRSIASRVEFLNLVTFLKTGEVTIGDPVTAVNTPFADPGQMAISADGRLVAVTTNTGVAVVRVQ